MNNIEKGSQTARNGFKNEDDIVAKFNNWSEDIEAKLWLQTMNYNLDEIEYVKAIKLHGHKTDVQVQITVKLKQAIDVQNLQVKLVSNKRGFNQIDKRWVDAYVDLWNIPASIIVTLKKYCGEIKPTTTTRNKRRIFFDEISPDEQNNLLKWFEQNKVLIINDILKGRGKFAAEWVLVAQKNVIDSRWMLKPMNVCINHYSLGNVTITPKGNLRIGKIGMQRKGGDGGRPTANMLQFKIDPTELFEMN